MATNELERRAAIGVGQLVAYDTIRSGVVKCRVIGTQPAQFSNETLLVLKVTSHNAYAYPRGHVFTARRSPFVYAR